MTLFELQQLATYKALDKSMQQAVDLGYNEGYEEGFRTAQIAERGIAKVMDKLTCESPVPTDDLATNAGAGSVHPIFDQILKTIKP